MPAKPRSLAVAVAAFALCVAFFGCSPRTQERAQPSGPTAETKWGPAVNVSLDDLPGDKEQSEAFRRMGELVAEHPQARMIQVGGTFKSSGGETWDITWEYDRPAGKFVYRQRGGDTGTTEYVYTEVGDEMLKQLGQRAETQFVDFSSLGTHGYPYDVVRNGKVVLHEPGK